MHSFEVSFKKLRLPNLFCVLHILKKLLRYDLRFLAFFHERGGVVVLRQSVLKLPRSDLQVQSNSSAVKVDFVTKIALAINILYS